MPSRAKEKTKVPRPNTCIRCSQLWEQVMLQTTCAGNHIHSYTGNGEGGTLFT